MHVLAIDAGSYSVKYIASSVDKKHATHLAMEEFVIAEAMAQNSNWETPEEASFQLIKRIVDDIARPDTRIVLHAPNESITTRFLNLPVKSRKKAEMMIPFQLEEDIPYALHESHFAWSLESGRTQSLALVALARDSEFSSFHERLQQIEPPVSLVSSEPSVFDAFYSVNQMAGAYCVLDIGHRSSKAYFFYNSKLIATHLSYTGGRHVDEMIAKTYGISNAEAVKYKHQNAFVLTDVQASEVDPNQKEFARLMDQVFRPLVSDFQKWELGFRVSHGIKLGQVFICGGSAAIKNMGNYLTDKLGVKTSLLESFEGVELGKVDGNSKVRSKFTLANLMALSLRAKGRLINLLTGRYALASRGDLPLHSFSFIAIRAVAVTAVLALVLLIEGVMLELDLKHVNAKINSVSKNPVLALSPRERRALTGQPKVALATLSKKQRAIRQQISTLQSASDIKALSPLIAIAAAAAGSPATLVEFTVTDTGDVTAVFTAQNEAPLEELRSRLGSVTLTNVNVQVDAANKRLTLTGIQ